MAGLSFDQLVPAEDSSFNEIKMEAGRLRVSTTAVTDSLTDKFPTGISPEPLYMAIHSTTAIHV